MLAYGIAAPSILLRAEKLIALRMLGEEADHPPHPHRRAAREERRMEGDVRVGDRDGIRPARRSLPRRGAHVPARISHLVRVVGGLERGAERARLEEQAKLVEVGPRRRAKTSRRARPVAT
jgi:hypothetical protein